ncbi:MAG: prepilin-type N-terminal cleavage/methylation domain-containing protein [Patescibacteria group bacterium]|nr:prepilin-type N-terminal cleavage/methylation domain-containing protein [Patescibacteria group bacterium]
MFSREHKVLKVLKGGRAGVLKKLQRSRTPALSHSSTSSRGVTVIELIMVLAVMLILATIVMPYLSDATRRSDLDAETTIAADLLSQAQFSAMSGKGGRRFGVHFETTEYVFFNGATYNAADTNNDVHVLPPTVTISAVSLVPAGSDVHFVNPKGTPTETGTVTFAGPDGLTKVISINAAGMIDVN